MQGRGLREPVEKHLVSVAMIEGKLQIALTCLRERSRAAECREEFAAGLQAHRAQDVVAVPVTLVKGRGCGASCLGNTAHGEGFFATPGPQPAGHVKNALFELRVC